MENSFITWENFAQNFGKELAIAEDVYHRMVDNGMMEYTLARFDYHFVSDKKEKLEPLRKYLEEHYPYEHKSIQEIEDEKWELNGVTNELPVTLENLQFWAIDMYKTGYEFDAIIDGYGAMIDPKNIKIAEFNPNLEDEYFNQAVKDYNNGNTSGAIINWSSALLINPKDPSSYYSRAVAKNELYTWKAALDDYNKAIDLAPNHLDALLNRGALKDENGDPQGAIEDYNTVISIDNLDPEVIQIAYYNRGNTKYKMNDLAEACKDWKTALDLGAEYAKENIEKFCN